MAYYYLEPILVSQTYQALIHRIDRETGKDRILCTKVGCSHDSPDCDALFSGSLIQRFQNLLILQDLGVLTSVPVGFQGHQEIFLKLPYSELRDLLDIKIYVEADADERILRRGIRDVKERGRDVEGIAKQYLTTVKPMHYIYVEPTKALADIVINSGMNDVAFDLIKNKIATMV